MLKLLQQAERYKKNNSWRRIFRRVICAIACVGVFCTTYAFVLPIITRGEDGFALEGYTQSSESADTESKEFYDNPNYWFEQLGGQYNPSDNSNSSGSDSDVSINSSDDQSGADGAIHDKTNSEHVASCLVCKNDPKADVETTAQWEETFANIALGNGWGADLVAIARSQLGYKESTRNYKVMEDGKTIKGYTRYGAWYGDAYGDWSAMFVSFCLNYAGIPWDVVPYEASCSKWVEVLGNYNYNTYRPAAEYTPALGDLIFFDDDVNGSADRVGIVSEVSYSKVKAIEGANGKQVTEKAYKIENGKILGYGQMPKEASVYFCGQQAHIHNASCNVESGVVICKKREHTHTEKCLHSEDKPQSDLLPKCDCDSDNDLKEHTDGCARYQYIRNTYIYESTATEIYEAWEALSEEDRDAVLTLMGGEPNLQEKFKKLKNMLEQSDSLYVEFGDGTKLSAEGIPMDAVFVATPGSKEKQHVSDSLAGNGANKNQKVFFNKAYDIKVVQGEQVWQPGVGETVKLTLATNSDEFTYKSQLKVTHILDDVDDILRAAGSDAYSVHTEAGLSEIFPEACEAAKAAGYEKDTIVYTIMTPQDGNVAFDSKGNVIIYAESFSTYAVSAYNTSAVAEDESGLVVDKTVSHIDGNQFELQLEAYVKGSVTNTPTDVVLLIDQSASMWSAVDNSNVLSFDDIKNDTEHGAYIGYYILFANVENPRKDPAMKYYFDPQSQNNTFPNDPVYTNAAALMRYNTTEEKWQITPWHFMANYDQYYDIADGEQNSYKGEDNWFEKAYVGDCFRVTEAGHGLELKAKATDLENQTRWKDYEEEAADQINPAKEPRFYKTISGALYDALNAFVKEMEKAEGCSVAIATFAGSYEHRYAGSGIFLDGVNTLKYERHTEDVQKQTSGDLAPTLKYTNAEYQKAFVNPTDQVGKQYLNTAINSLCTNYSNTGTAFGLHLVDNLFDKGIDANAGERNKVAIVFTDGLPSPSYLIESFPSIAIENDRVLGEQYRTDALNNGFSEEQLNAATGRFNQNSVRFHHYTGANKPKSVTTPYDFGVWVDGIGNYPAAWRSTYIDQAFRVKRKGATIYTIGSTATINRNNKDVLEWIATDADHASLVDGEDLDITFKKIAGVVLSSSLQPDENMYLQDVISDSFTLPADITTANIGNYIQAYKVYRDDNGEFYPKNADNLIDEDRWKPIPADYISVINNKTVQVRNLGFNDPNSWVIDEENKGYKVVVLINIDAVYSGTKLPTNKTDSSAVYYANDYPAKYFPLPYADVPTKVKLTKNFNRDDTTTQFMFEATYTQRNGYTSGVTSGLNDSNYLKITPKAMNEPEIKLVKNGSKEFLNLEVGTDITIKERMLAGYTVTVKVNGNVVTPDENGNIILTLQPNVPVSEYNYEIVFENYAGFELPSTGGVGTHLYTVGGLLLIIAAILLYIYHCTYRKEGSILSNK